MHLKDYTSISASAPSEVLTALALRNRHVLLERNLAIVSDDEPEARLTPCRRGS